MSEEHDDFEPSAEELERPRDPVTDDAKAALREFIAQNKNRVFYSRQLEVLLEKPFFHWITNRAVRELVAEGVFAVREEPLLGKAVIKLLIPKGLRYSARPVKRTLELVRRYSTPVFGQAMGRHAETMILGALAQHGFVGRGRDVSEFNGKKWTETKHNLDFVVERDEVMYGVEVKNTLDYIPRPELQLKVRMCEYFGVVPLLIARAAPKTYIWEDIVRVKDGVHRGFALLLGKQIYPYGHEDLVDQVVAELGLPVHAPRDLPDGDVERFLKWHRRWQRNLARL